MGNAGSGNASAWTHTIFPGFQADGYFDNDNVEFIRKKVADVLQREYHQRINVDRASVLRVMQRILEERIEIVPKMNQRVIMSLCAEIRGHQLEVNRNMKWLNYYSVSQRLYDPTTARGPDLQAIKLANRLGEPRVGGTVRFYFT